MMVNTKNMLTVIIGGLLKSLTGYGYRDANPKVDPWRIAALGSVIVIIIAIIWLN